jgi:hypothetical protein
MALFDNNPIQSLFAPVKSSIGGLFEGMTPFGSTIPGGILNEDQEAKLRNQALVQGILGTAATYFATPKNLNAGSPLPYIGKAVLGGMGASQDVIDRAIRAKLLAGRDDNIKTINQDIDGVRYEVTYKIDPNTGARTEIARSMRDAPVVEKPEGFTDTYKNVAIELFGTANPTALTPEQRKQIGAEIKAREIAKKPETKIVMPAGQTKYEETLGKIRAEQDVELVNTANKSKNNISKIDMTLNQLQNSDAITGFGADIQKNVNRFKAKVLKDQKAGKQVADTEILDAFLGSDVFPQIGALGIGAKGLDTPAEREFLRQVMTGTISMDKNALIRMTQIRRDIEKRAIDRYNQSLQSGELDDYFASTKRQKKLIDIPDNSGFRIVP